MNLLSIFLLHRSGLWREAGGVLTESMVTITTTTTGLTTLTILRRASFTQRMDLVLTGWGLPPVEVLGQAMSAAGVTVTWQLDSLAPDKVQVWARDQPGHPPSKPPSWLWGADWRTRGKEIAKGGFWRGVLGGYLFIEPKELNVLGEGRKGWCEQVEELRTASSSSDPGENQEHPSEEPGRPRWPWQRWWKEIGLSITLVGGIKFVYQETWRQLAVSKSTQESTHLQICWVAKPLLTQILVKFYLLIIPTPKL